MSSGVTRDINTSNQVIGASADMKLVNERLKRLGLSPRQLELNRLYAYFRTQQHEDCATAWDGSPHVDTMARASIVTQTSLPPGFTDESGQLEPLPLRYRRPSVPCHLCKLVVSRFTGLLYSEAQDPTWKVPGDPDTEAWVQAVSDSYGLWAMMMHARDMGGAIGTAVPGFKLVDSRVVFEDLDARWCFPTFNPKDPRELVKLEVRYMYPMDVRDPVTGQWREEKFWYLRVIDRTTDCLWKPVPVGDGSLEPKWDDPSTVDQSYDHNFGFVPYQWLTNLEVAGAIDGDPDCLGAYDYFDRIGELDSQIHGGAIRNADPTPVVASDGNLQSVATGSKRAVKLEKGGTLTFAETSGTATEAAAKESDRLEDKALQICECVLPDQRQTNRSSMTATEVTKRAAAMFAKASRLRTQYGARGAVPLMGKLIRVSRQLEAGRPAGASEVDASGTPIPPGTTVKSAIAVPPKVDDGQLVAHKLGNVQGVQLSLVWPPFDRPTPQDTAQTVQATVNARAARLISGVTATRQIAADFHIDSPRAELAEIGKEPSPPDLAARSLGELNEGR
jgi:hypothetical protein